MERFNGKSTRWHNLRSSRREPDYYNTATKGADEIIHDGASNCVSGLYVDGEVYIVGAGNNVVGAIASPVDANGIALGEV